MTRPSDLLPDWLINDQNVNGTIIPDRIHISPLNDGFTPSGCNGRSGKIIRDFPRDHPGICTIIDIAVSKETADLLYASAVKATVWGVYVSMSECIQHMNSHNRIERVSDFDETLEPDAYRHALARQTVQEFLLEKTGQWITQNDWERTHGVAVWVISSDCNDETKYHLDYAEQVRYESNVVFPPIYGATLHVSRLHSDISDEIVTDEGQKTSLMEGGNFHVNLTGLQHYDKYGYKTRKQPHRLTTDELEQQSETEVGWKQVSYQYRRGILCDGELPHFSGRVRSLPAAASPLKLPMKRVVVGFNLFPSEIGACVAKFPEHSSAFNRYVKLSQAAVKQTNKGGWTLASVRANPKQAAFLKLLARKVREHEKQKQKAAATVSITSKS
ncbi:unnamed protein product [Peronospora belbahrii]|uniref:Uncharacterized protein n=1 Tax=Peronospora belbahrii TaxID=622444 RepID=A0AAU9L6X1_9STRA|nr:unnamed protein product [Peronospora belbahrii]CAH0515135.1 unnamed protein product [Peronospora belbahrii]